jgi:hypothetical protein
MQLVKYTAALQAVGKNIKLRSRQLLKASSRPLDSWTRYTATLQAEGDTQLHSVAGQDTHMHLTAYHDIV